MTRHLCIALGLLCATSLARGQAEVERFTSELNKILGHVEQLRSVNVDGIEPTSHPLALTNVMREDVPRPSLSLEDVLRNAPEQASDGFRVPPVIEQF